MKQDLPRWFEPQIRQRYIEKDPSLTHELFALACGPSPTPILVNSCVVNGVSLSYTIVMNAVQLKTTAFLHLVGRTENCIMVNPKKFLSLLISRSNLCCSELSGSTLAMNDVVQDVYHKKYSNGDVIVVEDDHDVIHDNSFDLALSTSWNDLDFTTLSIDGQSTKVEAPPNIIPVDNNDNFIDDEDDVPHDLIDYHDEVLANVDDDDDEVMSAAVACGHGGDGGGDDPCRPLPRPIGLGCQGVEGQKATRGRDMDGGGNGVRQATRNVVLKETVERYDPQKIRIEWGDHQTMLQVGPNSAWWSNFVDEMVREFPMHYPSWHDIEPTKKAHIRGRLMEHMLGPRWTDIETRIEQHFTQRYSDNKHTLKRRADENHEYLSFISSFYDTHTHEDVWEQEDALIQDEETIKLRDMGANTPTGVPYTKEQILAMVIKGKQRGHILGRGSGSGARGGSGSGGGTDDYEGRDEDVFEDDNEGCCASIVLLGADDMSSEKVFTSLTLVDLVKLYPVDMSSRKAFIDFV
ncbi:hypothetical protein Tco_0526388 [Tanacetum coccineum]